MENIENPNKNFRLPEPILCLMKRMRDQGEEIYLVGGSVRDFLLGGTPHDYDMTTSALPEKTMRVYSDHRVIQTGLQHGTVTVMLDGEPIEITTFRIDGSYSDARHPDGVIFTRRVTEDLSRRDFTVNAMAYDPDTGLVDPFGGREDLERKILRTVGDPIQRFEEDALRILRVFRFSAQLGFEIEENTLLGCQNSKDGLTKIAKERIASEFLKLLRSEHPKKALEAMIDCGVLSYVVSDELPSARILEGLEQMPMTDSARLGFFFAETEREKAEKILREMKYSKKQITGASAVIRGAKTTIETPTDARYLISSCGVYAEEATIASMLLGNSSKEAVEWVRQSKAPSKISDLAVSGRDLMALGLTGKEVGYALNELLRMVIEDPTKNEKEQLIKIIKRKSL